MGTLSLPHGKFDDDGASPVRLGVYGLPKLLPAGFTALGSRFGMSAWMWQAAKLRPFTDDLQLKQEVPLLPGWRRKRRARDGPVWQP